MKVLNRFRINTKILGTVLFVVALGAMLATLGITYLNQMNKRLTYLVDVSAERVRLAGLLNQSILEVVRAEKNYILASNATERNEYNISTNTLLAEVDSEMATLKSMADANGQSILAVLQDHWQTYLTINQQIRQLVDEGELGAATDLSQGEARVVINLAMADVRALIDKNNTDMALDKQSSETDYRSALTWMISVSIASLLIGTIFGRTVSQNIATNLKEMVLVAEEISMGNVAHELKIESQDETGDLARSFGRTIHYLQDVTGIADEIASGNLSVEVKPRSNQDTLNQSIRQMVASLNQVTDENNQRIWQATGQSQLTDETRGLLDATKLGRQVITFLCRYLDAQIGALYLRSEQDLRLSASFAYTQRKNLSDHFKVGEGIVGQAALEKQAILISEVPEDYIRVQSGLGDSPPRHLLAIPFLFDKQVSGVIEMGRFQPWEEKQLNLLNSIIEYIAIVFNVAESYTRTQALLIRTQQQAEELQVQTEELETQQEELRQSNEALEQQARQLRESEQELKAQQEELEVINEELSEKTRLLENERSAVEAHNQRLQEAQADLEQQAKELTLASKYKSEFLSNMSHELRTPLNSMLILARLLSDNEAGTLTEEQVESARVIYNSGQDLLALINDILDLSKVEAGKMDFKAGDISLEELKNGLEKDFNPVAQETKLEWQTQLAAGLPDAIHTDRQRLMQILKNLLSNAFKFTERGGVTLRIERPAEAIAKATGFNPATAIAFCVIDSGIGIPKNEYRRIFEAFQQLDGSTSRKYSGTGLGLSISRELATFLGGGIHLVSEEGVGSTFTLVIPQQLSESIEAQAVLTPPAPLALKKKPKPASEIPEVEITSERVMLIIEDDDWFAGKLKQMAENKGFQALVAPDGETGLGIAKRYHPIGILLDLRLPNLDGWNVLSTLKANPELRHIPVHIISADEATPEAYRRGAMGFLTKPVTPEDLEGAFERMETFLSRKLKSLLIVEDDEGTRLGLKKLLGNGDIEYVETSSGQEALAIIRKRQIDCIILDLRLSDLSGFHFLDRLNAEPDLHKPPVIVYTGQELTREQNEHLMKYAETVIVKGIKSEERLLDETALFLHRVVADLPANKQQIIRNLYEHDDVFINKTILLVDDDIRNAFALSRLLSEKGLNIEMATSGQKALEMLAERPKISLVLMDVMMPEMDGYETMRRIRSQYKYAQLPMLALTAKAMPGDQEKCLAAGANDYLSKPVDIDRLLSLLRVWLYR